MASRASGVKVKRRIVGSCAAGGQPHIRNRNRDRQVCQIHACRVYINAESVCGLLRQIATAGLPRPITLVLDNARYQRCELVQALARSLRIELLFLPGYSPNLNLIERLWKFVKKECLASRSLPNYEAFTQAIDACLNSLRTKYKEQMTTLLTLNFQTYEDEPVLAA